MSNLPDLIGKQSRRKTLGLLFGLSATTGLAIPFLQNATAVQAATTTSNTPSKKQTLQTQTSGAQWPAITDLIVVPINVLLVRGYTRLPGNLNLGTRGKTLNFASSSEATNSNNETMSPITDVTIIYGPSPNIHAPLGFTKIPTNLNQGAGGYYIYACIRRDSQSPITGLQVITTSSTDTQPTDSSYLRIPLDLNLGTGGTHVYLCYRK